MHFSNAARRLGVGLAALAAAAIAAGSAIAADGQLYFASIVQEPVKVYLDGQLVSEVPYGKIARLDVKPGQHRLRVVPLTGGAAERVVTFDAGQLASSKGGLWWCAASATPDGSKDAILIVMDQAQCKDFVDAGN